MTRSESLCEDVYQEENCLLAKWDGTERRKLILRQMDRRDQIGHKIAEYWNRERALSDSIQAHIVNGQDPDVRELVRNNRRKPTIQSTRKYRRFSWWLNINDLFWLDLLLVISQKLNT